LYIEKAGLLLNVIAFPMRGVRPCRNAILFCNLVCEFLKLRS
jgi:hypothetical protein